MRGVLDMEQTDTGQTDTGQTVHGCSRVRFEGSILTSLDNSRQTKGGIMADLIVISFDKESQAEAAFRACVKNSGLSV